VDQRYGPIHFSQRLGAVDTDLQHRARVVRQDEAAVVTGTPPALLETGRRPPVAEAPRDVRVVESERPVVLRVERVRDPEHATGVILDAPARFQTDLAVFARRVVERTEPRRLRGAVHEPTGVLPAAGLQRRAQRLAFVLRDIQRRDRPGGPERHLPLVHLQLDLVAQPRIAGRQIRKRLCDGDGR
jgi:hypothetical protein